MFKLLGIGLIGYGWNIKKNTDKEIVDLNKTMKNEKIYVYPHDIPKLDLEPANLPNDIIVKIPHNLIDNKYYIGKIKLYKITKDTSTIIRYYDDDENKKLKITDIDHIKKEPYQSHLLFPTKILKEFELDQIMFKNNKIKILFDNTITCKSGGHENLIEKYFNIIQNSGINYSNQHNPIFYKYPLYPMPLFECELEENFISHHNDIFLLVNPFKQLSNLSEQQTLQSEEQTVQSEQQTVQFDQQTVQSEQQTLQSEEQTVQPEEQTLQSEEQTVQSEEQTVQSDQQTVQSEEQTLQSEEQTVQSEQQTVQSEQQTVQSEQQNIISYKYPKYSIPQFRCELKENAESDIKLNIVAIADDKDKIIKEKYHSEISTIEEQYNLSFWAVVSGIALLFIEI